MTSTEWWPFLISRGRRTPFRTVVVPGVSSATDLAPVMLDAAGGAPTPAGHARFRVIERPGADNLALAFRVVRPDAVETGGDGEPLRDEHSRPIYLIEGVLRTLPEGTAADRPRPCVPLGALQAAHEHNVPVFRRFWQADRYQFAPARSRALTFPAATPEEQVEWDIRPPIRMRGTHQVPAKPEQDPAPPSAPDPPDPSRRHGLWWGCLVVLLGAVAVAFLLLSG